MSELRLPKYIVELGKELFEYSNVSNIITDSPLYEVYDKCLYSRVSQCLMYCPLTVTSIAVKEGTKSIADWALKDCSSLESILLPDSIEKIGECAFWRCESLKNIIMPRNLEELGHTCFEYCKSLESIYVHPSDNVLKTLYKDEGLRNKIITITDTVVLPTQLDFRGFIREYNEDRKKYQRCPDYWVKDNQIDEGVEVICDDSFNSLYDETDGYYLNSCNLIIPSTVKEIGKNVFDGPLASIINKSPYFSVEGDVLFSNDKKKLYRYFGKQKYYIVPNFVEEIIGGAFVGSEIDTVVVPKSVIKIGDNPFANAVSSIDEMKPCIVKSESSIFDATEAILVNNVGMKLISYFGNKDEFIVPDGIKVIGTNAFFGSKVKRVWLPNTIECIDETSFYWCFELEKIFIPKGKMYDFKRLVPSYLLDRITETQ